MMKVARAVYHWIRNITAMHRMAPRRETQGLWNFRFNHILHICCGFAPVVNHCIFANKMKQNLL